MRVTHAAAPGAQGRQRRAAAHAGCGHGHGVAVAHEVHTLHTLAQVGVHAGQVVEHARGPQRRGAVQQRGAVAHWQRVVGRQHGGAATLAQTLVHGVDIAQAGGAIDHAVPTGRRAGAVEQRPVQLQIGHQPGRVLHGGHGGQQRGWWRFDDARGHEQGQRQHHALRAPLLQLLCRVVPGPHVHAVALLMHAQHHAAALHAPGVRRGQARGQPGVAFGPGEDGVAFSVFVARCVKAVAAGKVVQPGPGRHGRGAGAVVVAATVVQVPQQPRVVDLLARQPGGKGDGVQRSVRCRPRRARAGQGEADGLHARHRSGKTAVLRQCGRTGLGRRQQAIGPGAVDEQTLLRAVAQVAFFGHRAAQLVAQQADFVQPFGHLARLRPGQRQVVRAQRAGHAGHVMAAAVAAGLDFQLQQVHVVDARTRQAPRGRQAGDARAQHQHLRAPLHRRCGPVARLGIAQAVAACVCCAHPLRVRRRCIARACAAGQRQCAAAQQRAPAQHGDALIG